MPLVDPKVEIPKFEALKKALTEEIAAVTTEPGVDAAAKELEAYINAHTAEELLAPDVTVEQNPFRVKSSACSVL